MYRPKKVIPVLAAVFLTAVTVTVWVTGWKLHPLMLIPLFLVPRVEDRTHGPGFWDFDKSELFSMLMVGPVSWLFFVTFSYVPPQEKEEMFVSPRFLFGLWCFVLLVIAKNAVHDRPS